VLLRFAFFGHALSEQGIIQLLMPIVNAVKITKVMAK